MHIGLAGWWSTSPVYPLGLPFEDSWRTVKKFADHTSRKGIFDETHRPSKKSMIWPGGVTLAQGLRPGLAAGKPIGRATVTSPTHHCADATPSMHGSKGAPRKSPFPHASSGPAPWLAASCNCRPTWFGSPIDANLLDCGRPPRCWPTQAGHVSASSIRTVRCKPDRRSPVAPSELSTRIDAAGTADSAGTANRTTTAAKMTARRGARRRSAASLAESSVDDSSWPGIIADAACRTEILAPRSQFGPRFDRIDLTSIQS